MEGEAISFKFEGQVEEVDINTFTHVMMNYAKVVEAAAKEIDENSPMRINVRAVKPGCLDVVLGVVQNSIGGLFADPVTSLNTVAAVITIAGGLYGFKKHLSKNGKIAKVEPTNNAQQLEITTDNGSTTIIDNHVYNIYVNNPEVDRAINASFDTLENDERIESLLISKVSSGEKLFTATRDEFAEIANSPSFEGNNTRHVVTNERLIVIKPVLEKTSRKKWEFLWNNISIKAAILDSSFIDNVLANQAFGIGTVMDVELDTTQEFSEDLQAYTNKKYEIKEVKNITNKPENQRLFN
jgi:hypothetical protein